MRRILLTVLPLLAALVVAAPASAAVKPWIKLGATALVGQGAGLDLRYTVQCPAGSHVWLYAEVLQGTTEAVASVHADCTGRAQSFPVRARSNSITALAAGPATINTSAAIPGEDGAILQKSETRRLAPGRPANTYQADPTPRVDVLAATLDAATNSVTVTFATRCAAGAPEGFAGLSVAQGTPAGRMALANGVLSIPCAGGTTRQRVTVTGYTDMAAFPPGSLIVGSKFSYCEPAEPEPYCYDRVLDDTVRLV